MTDNRTNEQIEPTEAQVEAAARALWSFHGLNGEWDAGTHEAHENCREDARNALVAAAAATPQAESDVAVTCRCRHGVGAHDFSDPQERCRMVGCRCQGWFGVVPAVRQVSESDLAAGPVIDLEQVIDALVRTDLSDYAGTDMGMIRAAARAVVDAIGGENR